MAEDKRINEIVKDGEVYKLSMPEIDEAVEQAQQSAKEAAEACEAAVEIVTGTNELVGGHLIPTFSQLEHYKMYDLVIYRRSVDEKPHLWKALVDNGPGEWVDANWVQTSYYEELRNSLRIETVRVRVQFTDGTTGYSGKTITAVIDGVTHTYTTDSDGYALFTVPYGIEYSVIAPNISGYVTPKTASKVANSNTRNINFAYRKYTVGLSVITSDGTEIDFSLWNTANNANAVLLKLTTTAGNCCFQIHNAPAARKWASINLLFPSLPELNQAGATADYDGVGNTQKIHDDWEVLKTTNPSLTIPAWTFATETYVTIGGTPHYGYIPAVGQLLAIKNNIFDINQALLTLGGNQLAITSGRWWSSSQNGSDGAWHLYNGSLNLYGSKANEFQVLPLFDF